MAGESDERAPFGISQTRRYTRSESEAELYLSHTVDGSSIELVDYMGGPEMVERVATAGHGRSVFAERPSSEELIRHLVDNGIYTPFRSVQLKFSIRAPIMVALAFVYDPRANVNEYSGRYSVMPETSWSPSRALIASHFSAGVHDAAERIARIETLFSEGRQEAFGKYKGLLETDLARELARTGLGIDNDTMFFWKMDLVSLASFVKRERKRLHPADHTRACVEQIDDIAREVGGYAWDALMGELDAKTFPWLTPPCDDDLVDCTLSPPAWGFSSTRRVCVQGLEGALFVSRPVLDHGSFHPVDYMGDDSSIAQAARTSYGRGTKKLQDDIALINSLARDAHTTPLEMAELAVESRVPLFADPRQAGRHRTLEHHGFMGDFPMGSRFYFPADDQCKYQDRVNRQGRGKDMDVDDRERAKRLLQETFEGQVARATELRGLGAPEYLVRRSKGVGFYTHVWRTGDAHNWGKFLGLRLDPHAQYEVRRFAEEADRALALQLPATHHAVHTYMIDGMRLSSRDVEFIQRGRLLDPAASLNDFGVYASLGLTIPVDKTDPSKGIKLSREGEGLAKKVHRLRGQS